MNLSSILRVYLYLSLILLIFLVAISFNSLRMITINGARTIRTAQDRFLQDNLEIEIKDALIDARNKQKFSEEQIEAVNEKIIRFEQMLKGYNLRSMEIIKNKWEKLKFRHAPDPDKIIQEFNILHTTVNKIILEDLHKRQANTERDAKRIQKIKLGIGSLILTMFIAALYLDSQQTKKRNEFMKKAISNETLKNLADSIGHEAMVRVVQAFMLELPKAETSINQLITEKNIDELHKVGHRNKSASQTVGAMELAELFKQLEVAPKLETAIDLNTKINSEANLVMSELQEQITSVH